MASASFLDITEGDMEAHRRLKKKLELSKAGAHPILHRVVRNRTERSSGMPCGRNVRLVH
jgi:hypothetical protein